MAQRIDPHSIYTLIARSLGWGNNVLANLPRILELSSAMLSHPNSRRAVIVGAGPSLERNVHWLRLFDGLVLATNTAAPAVEAAGRAPDVIVAIESMDTTSRCPTKPGRWAIDLQAHPAWFAHAGDRAMWLTDQMPATERLSADMHAPQLIGGTAALTYAVALAAHWAMEEIIIIGADLSYPVSGAAYARNTGWAEVTTLIDDGRYFVQNGSERERVSKDAGLNPDPGGVVFSTPAWRDGDPDVYASTIFKDQRKWLMRYPGRYLSTRFINATEGGANVPGWTPAEFGTLCNGTARTPCQWYDVRVSREDYIRALENVHRDAIAYHAGAITILEGRAHGPVAIEGAHRWCPLADYFHTPDTLKLLQDKEMQNNQKLEIAYNVHVAVGKLLTEQSERLLTEARAA